MGFFSSDPFVDPQLGRFERRGGAWVGTISLPRFGEVALRLAGDRRAPSEQARARALQAAAEIAAHSAQIAEALLEHLEPIREAVADGEHDVGDLDLNTIRSADDVWSAVRVLGVDVDPTARDFDLELQMDVAWDDEHTLGARWKSGAWVELNGSVPRMAE